MTIHQQIIQGMAKAFFACAWAEQCEEAGRAGLESFGYAVWDYFKVPYVEFSGHSLSKDYF